MNTRPSETFNPKSAYPGDYISYISGVGTGLQGHITSQEEDATGTKMHHIMDGVIRITTASAATRDQALNFWQGRKIAWGFACFFPL